MSERKRHNARHNARLPENATEQRRLLRWLVQEEARILEDGKPAEQERLPTLGLRTNPKDFYDNAPPSNVQRAAHSRALQSLARRGLILLPSQSKKGAKPPPVRYVRLTPAGRLEAQRRTASEREKRFRSLIDSGEIPLPPELANLTFRAADDGKALIERLSALHRDTKALHALIGKHAPDSPALPRLSKLILEIEGVEDNYTLVVTATAESVESADQRLEANAQHVREALHRIEVELQSLLTIGRP